MSSSSALCPEKTRHDLEVDALLEAVASRCASHTGQALARRLGFVGGREAALESLGEIEEARALEDRGEPLPREAFPEVVEALGRARVGAPLSSEEIRAVSKILGGAARLRKFLKAHKELAPRLSVSCDTNAEHDRVAFELERSFEPDGTIADSASTRLAELRSERKASRDRIVRKLEELVARYAGILSDGYWTERDGRYVLPVRADAHERFPGIVHAASSGGATLFVEPRVIVPMGNRQKVLDAQVAREEEIILARLTALVAEAAPAVLLAIEALSHADLRAAQARLAFELRLTTPDIPERRSREDVRISLVRARHPLLVLAGVDVIPSDMEVRAGRILVLSGPNAGGKTVAMKTLGLAALLVRLGMPVPAAEGSVVSMFDVVLTDVGDEQSLSKSLSTFSAHVQNLAAILDETHEGALVLLDEVTGGTDPREGEALATAILESLSARGGAVVTTTHYEGLKVLALRDDRFQNASVGFDLERMEPTFRVLTGVPGASSALAVARRYGIPAHLVTRAEALLPEGAASVADLVMRLEAERIAAARAKVALEEAEARVREQERELEEERARVIAREQKTAEKESESLVTAVRRAREELRAAEARLRRPKLDRDEVAEAARIVDKVAATVAVGGSLEAKKPPERPPVARAEVTVGSRVFVPRLRTDAEVLEVLPSGQIRVAAGPLKLLTTIDEVRRAEGKGGAKGSTHGQKAPKPSIVFDAAADPDLPIQTSDNTVDLRGLRAHEAVAIAEQF
ncbi:MAG TPA: endonuclease MutS2, partial [Polyangiaceae bacterium]|nr:endonuclease MutS2 [Polyangiaceae bacterium]